LHQLQQANLKKIVEPINEGEKTINELREAWAEMLTQNPEHNVGEAGSLSLQA
jgi:flagellin-specific chaperone FliS